MTRIPVMPAIHTTIIIAISPTCEVTSEPPRRRIVEGRTRYADYLSARAHQSAFLARRRPIPLRPTIDGGRVRALENLDHVITPTARS